MLSIAAETTYQKLVDFSNQMIFLLRIGLIKDSSFSCEIKHPYFGTLLWWWGPIVKKEKKITVEQLVKITHPGCKIPCSGSRVAKSA